MNANQKIANSRAAFKACHADQPDSPFFPWYKRMNEIFGMFETDTITEDELYALMEKFTHDFANAKELDFK